MKPPRRETTSSLAIASAAGAAKASEGSARRQSVAELRELQRKAFALVSHPLAGDGQTAQIFSDGRPMSDVASDFIKPNDRLTALERISIYNRQYWFRLLDCLHDDYPGLLALLGAKKFEKLRVAYLTRYPSASFTLRNLGSRLVQFIEERSELVSPQFDVARDMARFEWAQVEAFDEAARPPIRVDDLLGQDPTTLQLDLQPHVRLLEMDFPLDDYVLAVKKAKTALRSEASNAVETDRPEKATRRVPPPRKSKTFLAVHRFDNALFYRRLDPPEYLILTAIRRGLTLTQACGAALADGDAPADLSEKIQGWFKGWTEVGWFCKRQKSKRR